MHVPCSAPVRGQISVAERINGVAVILPASSIYSDILDSANCFKKQFPHRVRGYLVKGGPKMSCLVHVVGCTQVPTYSSRNRSWFEGAGVSLSQIKMTGTGFVEGSPDPWAASVTPETKVVCKRRVRHAGSSENWDHSPSKENRCSLLFWISLMLCYLLSTP